MSKILPWWLWLVVLLRGATPGAYPTVARPPRVVLLAQSVRDSMSGVFRRFNRHWDELGDLNSLERMLGTVRPTQLEYLGCLQGTVQRDTVRIESWQPAAKLRQLQLAVAGDCHRVPRVIGTWHTHPYRADLQNLPVKERSLSTQDLETFRDSGFPVTLVMWEVDSVDAAVSDGQEVVHPIRVLVKSVNGKR